MIISLFTQVNLPSLCNPCSQGWGTDSSQACIRWMKRIHPLCLQELPTSARHRQNWANCLCKTGLMTLNPLAEKQTEVKGWQALGFMQGPVLGSRSFSPSCLPAAWFEATQHFAKAGACVALEEEDVAVKMPEEEPAPPISDELPPRDHLVRQVKAETSLYYPCPLAFITFPLVNCWKRPKIRCHRGKQ